jgi:transposase
LDGQVSQTTAPAGRIRVPQDFDNWRAQLKWQRLAPYGRFADMIERHWDGLATTYCRPENKVSLGFVERLNNKMHVLQRHAYDLRDPSTSASRSSPACFPSIDPKVAGFHSLVFLKIQHFRNRNFRT